MMKQVKYVPDEQILWEKEDRLGFSIKMKEFRYEIIKEFEMIIIFGLHML